MKKLELHHLAGYLPYGLGLVARNVLSETPRRIYSNLNAMNIMSLVEGDSLYKPILRPLSDLTRKELELEGFDSHIDYLTYENKGSEWTLKAPFNMVQYLLSQHLDIHGLIPQKLAIDKNTLL